MLVLNICAVIICYCLALLIAVEKKSVISLRYICANATRLVPVLACLSTLIILNACGGNPDDHTGENWLLLIGLLLCWLKG